MAQGEREEAWPGDCGRWPIKDFDGCPRGQCCCCDCLEWQEWSPWRNVVEARDWWDNEQPEPRAYLVEPEDLEERTKHEPGPDDCQRCGCPASRHEDITQEVSKLRLSCDWWGDLERCLYRHTRGVFIPEKDAFVRRQQICEENFAGCGDIVSVICPTGPGRRRFHPFLYNCFYQQTHIARELVVVETGCGEGPSEFFTQGPPASDPRVLYRYFDVHGESWSIGTKRNIACFLAAGSVIVHFDDDDIYTQEYLDQMLQVLRKGSCGKTTTVRIESEGNGGVASSHAENTPPLMRDTTYAAEAATLSVWHTFDLSAGSFALCDPAKEQDPVRRRRWTFGYGFSFAYLRDAWRAHFFPDINLGEDTDFLESILARGGRVALVRDSAGICAHTHHNANFSKWESDKAPVQGTRAAVRVGKLATMGPKLQEYVALPPEVARELRPVMTSHQIYCIHVDLFSKYNTEAFQRKLYEVWVAAPTPLKQQSARREIVFAVQRPVLIKYGFPATLAGSLMMMNHHPEKFASNKDLTRRSWLLNYLVSPEEQIRQPLERDGHSRYAVADYIFHNAGDGKH